MIRQHIKPIRNTLISACIVGLLLPPNFNSFLIVIFTLFSVLYGVLDQRKWSRPSPFTILYIGFFAIFILSFFIFGNKTIALRALGKNVVWLIVPLTISIYERISLKDRLAIFIPFSWATQIIAFVLLLFSLAQYFRTSNVEVLYYTELTALFGYHPIYFSLYLLFSYCIIYNGFITKSLKIPLWAVLLVGVFDLGMLILLASKSILIISLVLIIGLFLKGFKKNKWLLLLGIIMIGMILYSPITKHRFVDSINSNWDLLTKESFEYNDSFTGVSLRLITWYIVLEKMEANEFVIGVGSGNRQDFIDEAYRDYNMHTAGYLGFNMHNQYLDYLVGFGIIGLGYFIFILSMFFRKSIFSRDLLYFIFLLSFSILAFSESNLQVHRGLVFFVLVNSVFFFSEQKNKKICPLPRKTGEVGRKR